ncbi:MAG: ATP synthase F1 subunit gamma, partial [Acidobacteriota bacterium]
MANRRVLVKRRKSVGNIRKITRTMQLIATARFQAALNRAVETRPYSDKLAELVADLSRAAGADHPLMQVANPSAPEALVVITSNRGLCGGYNANVLRTSIEHLDGLEGDARVTMVGKKGAGYYRYLGRTTEATVDDIDDRPRFEQVEPLANGLINAFVDGEVSAVKVVSMRFYSTSRQQPEVTQLLPLQRPAEADDADEDGAAGSGASAVEYEFRPDPQALLDDLLPASVRTRLFQCFTDAAVSEQVARMIAMKAATDAAG